MLFSSSGKCIRFSESDVRPMGRVARGVIGIRLADDGDDIMLISNGGMLVRTSADEISTLGRNTQGVTLIRLRNDEQLVGLARIQEEEGEDVENIPEVQANSED